MATPANFFIVARESVRSPTTRERVDSADDQMSMVSIELARQRSLRASSSVFAANKRLRKQREAAARRQDAVSQRRKPNVAPRPQTARPETPDDSTAAASRSSGTPRLETPPDDMVSMATPAELPEPRAGGGGDAMDARAAAGRRRRPPADKKPVLKKAGFGLVFARVGASSARILACDEGGGSGAIVAARAEREQVARRTLDITMAHRRSLSHQRLSVRTFPASAACPIHSDGAKGRAI